MDLANRVAALWRKSPAREVAVATADLPGPKLPTGQSSYSKRVRTPSIQQMEATECGAVSLAIILAYHGRWEPLETLRAACGVSRDGSKAANIVKAARLFGLDSKGLKKEVADVGTLAMPLIVFWNFNHFLVVEGFADDKVYVSDPAKGRRIVSRQEFDQAYTGIVLTFEKNAQFQRAGQPPNMNAALRQRLRGSGSGLVYAFIASLALAIPTLITPQFSRIFIDAFLVRRLTDWLPALLLAMAGATLLIAVTTWLQQQILLRLQTSISIASSARFFWHLLQLPIDFFATRQPGDISTRITSNQMVANTLAQDIAATAASLLIVVFLFLLMLKYDTMLAMIGLSSAVLNIVALRLVNSRKAGERLRISADSGKLASTNNAGLQQIETLKANGAEADFFARWSGQFSKASNASQTVAVSGQALSLVPTLITGINTVAVLMFGAYRVMNGFLTMGMLIAFQSLMAAFLKPVSGLVGIGERLEETRGNLRRLDDVLNSVPVPRAAPAEPGALVRKLEGRLELKNVTFGYTRLDPPLIENFSLTVEPGQRVALVGGSGSGKSTVAKLVSGLYAPWQGEVLFDGKQRADIPVAVIASSVSMVDQDLILFAGTIRQNITLWDPTISDSVVVQSGQDASFHDDIMTLPAGYDYPVSEGGLNFSGGQRQRLEIARALAINPRILIMDEATSALDTTTEKYIDDQLRRRGCTCLIVAHRLSTIRDCDEIIVLSAGKVVQRGTHESMSKVDGPYRKLIQTI